MTTQIAIDKRLLLELTKAQKQKTRREAVESALKAYLAMKKRKRALDLFGKIEFDDYDYKSLR